MKLGAWRLGALGMACLAVERVAVAGAVASSHGANAPVVSSTGAASLRVAGWSSQRGSLSRVRSVSGPSTRTETKRFVGRRVSSGAPLVCRSAVSPLSDSNGNVSEFESEEEFNTILKDAGDKLVVVDISTKTCGPCKMIYPKLVEMSLAYPDAVFLKINGDTNANTRALMRKWAVRAVPSFRFYRNKNLVHSHTGAKVEELKTRFAEHYGQPANV